MKTQDIKDMIDAGASQKESAAAYKLFKLLEPGLRIKKNGRIATSGGDKTPLGLYRIIGSQIFS